MAWTPPGIKKKEEETKVETTNPVEGIPEEDYQEEEKVVPIMKGYDSSSLDKMSVPRPPVTKDFYTGVIELQAAMTRVSDALNSWAAKIESQL